MKLRLGVLVRLVNDRFTQEWQNRGAWVAHSVEHLTFGFSSGHDLRVVESSPKWGSTLSQESA